MILYHPFSRARIVRHKSRDMIDAKKIIPELNQHFCPFNDDKHSCSCFIEGYRVGRVHKILKRSNSTLSTKTKTPLSQGEGDRWYYDVELNNLNIRVFNPVTVIYSK